MGPVSKSHQGNRGRQPLCRQKVSMDRTSLCNHDVRSLTTTTNAFAFRVAKGRGPTALTTLCFSCFATHFHAFLACSAWATAVSPPKRHREVSATKNPTPDSANAVAVTLMFAKALANTWSLSNSSHRTASHVDYLNLVKRDTIFLCTKPSYESNPQTSALNQAQKHKRGRA